MAHTIKGWIAGALALGLGACTPLRDLGWGPEPLTISDPISAGTKGRLARVMDEPQACYDWLGVQGVKFTPVPDRTEAPPGGESFCTIHNALILPNDAVAKWSPARPMMTCPLASALAVWRRQSVEPAAQEILGTNVAQIDHLGVYACRRIYGQAEGRPSAHAQAAAIDIAGFRLANGKRITVEKDWPRDSPESRFLHRVRDDACRVFATTLSPDYNAEHANHLHLEAGRWGLCS